MIKKICILLDRQRYKNRMLVPVLWIKDSLHRSFCDALVPYVKIRKRNAIFLPLCKTGNTSIKKVFFPEINYTDKTLEEFHRAIKTREKPMKDFLSLYSKNNFIFTFTRNPYSRLVSFYKDKIKYHAQLHSADSKNGIMEALANDYNHLFYTNMSFEACVCVASKIQDNLADPHFKTQCSFLVDKKGNLIPNFVGRFENLQNDFDYVLKKLKINCVKLPHLNETKKENWLDYYNEETIKLVNKRYKKDFKFLGYKMIYPRDFKKIKENPDQYLENQHVEIKGKTKKYF